MSNKKVMIPLILLAIIVSVRIALQPVLHKQMNKKLAEFSSVVKFHVDDIDLGFIRLTVGLENITGKLKKSDREFLDLDSLRVTADWGDLLKGKIVANTIIEGMSFHHSQEFMQVVPTLKKELEQLSSVKKSEEESRVQLAKLKIKNSNILLEDQPQLRPAKTPHISKITLEAFNLTPDKKNPLSTFDFKAVLLGAGGIESVGTMKLLSDPIEWSVDGEVQKLDMTAVNRFLINKVPLTFTKGTFDLYGEAISEDGKITGYLKPFGKDIDVMKAKEDFEGPRHWFIELVGAVGNLILQAPNKKSVATRVPFTYEGKLRIEAQEAVGNALEHAFDGTLERGIEHKYELK